MKKSNKTKVMLLLAPLLVIITAVPKVCMASSQPTVDLGTNSHFVGHIFELQSIDANTVISNVPVENAVIPVVTGGIKLQLPLQVGNFLKPQHLYMS